MQMKPFLFVLISVASAVSQQDSILLKEFVVSATRTEKKLTAVPMPVLLVKPAEIQASGSSRLQDILAEQPGLNIVPQINGFGNGLQIQGLNPDYTMIMVDGEPVIGRLTGNLELSRIPLANVKRIEIVKGPSSSLYGSEALGGVVNIITRNAVSNSLDLGIKYASYQTIDANLQAGYHTGRFSCTAFANHYRTQGFDLFPQYFGQTVSPFHNNSVHVKLKQEFAKGHVLELNTRYFDELQDNEYQVVNGMDSIRVFGHAHVRDISLHPSVKIKLADPAFLQVHAYASQYETQTRLLNRINESVYYNDTFKQTFVRPEAVVNCFIGEDQKWTAGAGTAFEALTTSRYGDQDAKEQQTTYAFLQHEWSGWRNWEFVTGIRFDHNSVYRSQWSPKIAIQRTFGPSWTLKASFGHGFKSPDFRYLYLNFRNGAAAYSVFGTEQVKPQLQVLDANGEILQYLADINTIGKLDAERSMAFNLGCQYRNADRFMADLNLFRNDLHGLIESLPVALTTDLRTIYSYSNIKRAYTQGIELSLNYALFRGLQLSSSTQVLFAKDKEVEDQLDKGLIFGRDPVTKESYRITSADYFGLYNRSRLNQSVKLFYSNARSGWEASVRILFKSKFGIPNTAGSVQGAIRPPSDSNDNGILDRYDRFVHSYVLTYCSIGKKFGTHFNVRAGADNLFNFTDAEHLPNISGRIMYLSVHYNFIYKKSST